MELIEGEGSPHSMRISDIEGMAHLIMLEKGKIWLVNNWIDFNMWNELYE